MSALPPRADLRFTSDQFVISHGKSGALGVFTSGEPLALKRGQRVVIQTNRGLEVGAVLRAASLTQSRVLGATSSGVLLRPLTAQDEAALAGLRELEQQIFEACQGLATDMHVLDVEMLFDGRLAIVQFVGPDSASETVARHIEHSLSIAVRMENLAQPHEHEEGEPGCGKPDCGQSEGGCTSCSTGGGCSSCGSKVDMRDYFAHLRTQMDRRTPLA